MTWIELFSFSGVGMRLHFELNVMKPVLVMQGFYFCCRAALTQHQELFCCSPHSTSKEAGDVQEVQRGHRQENLPQMTKRTLHSPWHHTQHIKLGQEGNREGCSEWSHLPFQVTVTCDEALLSWGWLNPWLQMGTVERVSSFALLAWAAFALCIELILLQPVIFLTFSLLVLSPIPPEERESVAAWGLVAAWS